MTARYNLKECESRWQKAWGQTHPAATASFGAAVDEAEEINILRPLLLADIGARFAVARGAVETGAIFRLPHGFSVIDTYGHDAARLFVASAERGGNLEDALTGAWRFVNRLWRVAQTADKNAARQDIAVHRAIQDVTYGLESGRHHIAVAALYTLAAVLERAHPADVGMLARLAGPLMPHVAAEMELSLKSAAGWQMIDSGWPAHDPDILAESMVETALHVNGKPRARIRLSRDAAPEDAAAAALANDIIRHALDGRVPKKIISVPNRIINVVI